MRDAATMRSLFGRPCCRSDDSYSTYVIAVKKLGVDTRVEFVKTRLLMVSKDLLEFHEPLILEALLRPRELEA